VAANAILTPTTKQQSEANTNRFFIRALSIFVLVGNMNDRCPSKSRPKLTMGQFNYQCIKTQTKA
jgi:hypothetical protein